MSLRWRYNHRPDRRPGTDDPIISLHSYLIKCSWRFIPVYLVAALLAFTQWPTSPPDNGQRSSTRVDTTSSTGMESALAPTPDEPSPLAEDVGTVRPEDMVFAKGSMARDLTGWMSPRALEHLDSLSDSLKYATGIQIGVLVVPDLGGEDIESFSLKVARKWALGQKKKNNGILLLLSRRDRNLRIEVGRGLEGDLTDLQSHRIIDETMVPFLKRGLVDNAVTAGVEKIIGIVAPDFPFEHREWAAPVPVVRPIQDFGVSTVETVTLPWHGLFVLLLAPMLAFTGWMVVVRLRFRWLLLPIAATGIAVLFSEPLALGTGFGSFMVLGIMAGFMRGDSNGSSSGAYSSRTNTSSGNSSRSSSNDSSGGGGSFGGGGASGKW